MPARRPYTRRPRSRRRTPWYRRKYSALQAGGYLARQVWRLKGLVNSETFKHDVGASINVSNSTGAGLISLSAIAQGDTQATRTGTSIFARALNGSLLFERNASATYTYLRYMILIDTQQIASTVPTISDVLQSDHQSHLNTTTVGRFKILKGGHLRVDGTMLTREVKINIPMRHHIRYANNSDTSYQKGEIYLLLLSSESTNTPIVRYNFRLSYHDN